MNSLNPNENPTEPASKQTHNLVSIITAAYNSAQTIGETIQSVLNQTYSHWEMLVILDQGTTDSTPDIVKDFAQKDSRIHLHQIQGRGVAHARNWGLNHSCGTWICFLDADDLWLPHKLQQQINFMLQNPCSVVATGFCRFTPTRVGRRILPPKKQDYSSLLGNNQIPFSSAMIRGPAKDLPRFEERPQEDYIFWLDLLKPDHFCLGLREDLMRYRITPMSRSTRDPRLRSRWWILRHREKLNLARALWNYSLYIFYALRKRFLF